MKKVIVIFLVVILLAVNSYAGEIFGSYQGAAHMPEDDNMGYGKAFYGQAGEVGYSWKYIELGVEYYVNKPKTLFGSTFVDHSVIGTAKLKYTIPWKWLDKLTPYGVVGIGTHFYTNKDFKTDPNNPVSIIPESLHNTTSIALKYGGGIEFKITRYISIFGEITYRYGDTGEPSSIDIYAWSYGSGVKVRF